MAAIGTVESSASGMASTRLANLPGELKENYMGSLVQKGGKDVKIGTQYESGRVTAEKGRTVTSSVVTMTVNQIVGPRKHPLEITWKKAQVGE